MPCGLVKRLYRIFPHYLTNSTIFGKHFLNIKLVLRFSLQLLSEIFFIMKRLEPDMIKKMYIGLHIKYLLFFSDFNET